MKVLAVIIVILSMCACSSMLRTQISSFPDPSYAEKEYSLFVVKVDSDDLLFRKSLEEQTAQLLTFGRVKAVSYLHLLPPTRTYTPEEVTQRLNSYGTQALLVYEVVTQGPNPVLIPAHSRMRERKTTERIKDNSGNEIEREKTEQQVTRENEFSHSYPWLTCEVSLYDFASGERMWMAVTVTRGYNINQDISVVCNDIAHSTWKALHNNEMDK